MELRERKEIEQIADKRQSMIGRENKESIHSKAKELKDRVACFPQIGDYSVPLSILIKGCFGCNVMTCPTTTKKTVEIGARNSPDTVCTPFKITLGNFMEAMEQGADILIMPGMGCRLGFYDILQTQILKDLHYDFEMLPLFDYTANANRLYKSLNDFWPLLTRERFDQVLAVVVRIVLDMDKLADQMRKNMAFELNKGEFEKSYRAYLAEASNSKTLRDAEMLGEKYREIFNSIALNKPQNPIRIGLIGDLYTVIEPHGNSHIEKWLAEHGIEIHRATDLTFLTRTLFNVDEQIAKSGDYISYYIGGSANNSVALAYEMASKGFDGIIHMKAATCSPEITAMTILQNISKDYGIPVLYFTFDVETSEAGFHTRLEAFHDMLLMKKKEQKKFFGGKS